MKILRNILDQVGRRCGKGTRLHWLHPLYEAIDTFIFLPDYVAPRHRGIMNVLYEDGHVEKEVGPNYGRLLQLYGVHKTMREARRKRLRVTREQETDGSIRLSLAA